MMRINGLTRFPLLLSTIWPNHYQGNGLGNLVGKKTLLNLTLRVGMRFVITAVLAAASLAIVLQRFGSDVALVGMIFCVGTLFSSNLILFEDTARREVLLKPHYKAGVLRPSIDPEDRTARLPQQALIPPLLLISDAHQWINKILTIPIHHLAKPLPRERAWKFCREKRL